MSATYYDEARRKVEGFETMATPFMQRLVIDGKSKSTHENHHRQIAKMSLHCGLNPLEMEADEIENYPYDLVNRDTDSQSSFKCIYKFLFIVFNINIKTSQCV